MLVLVVNMFKYFKYLLGFDPQSSGDWTGDDIGWGLSVGKRGWMGAGWTSIIFKMVSSVCNKPIPTGIQFVHASFKMGYRPIEVGNKVMGGWTNLELPVICCK